MPGGAGQHARPDVGHAGHLQQPLDRAVLAEGPVQHREDDVHAAEHLTGPARLEHHQPAAGGVAGQRDGGGRRVDGRQLRPWIASRSGSSVPSTQAPSRAMPTGTTSNRSRSRWRSTLPAETQEMACSLLRPPNTTATRVRPAVLDMGAERRASAVVQAEQAQVRAPRVPESTRASMRLRRYALS